MRTGVQESRGCLYSSSSSSSSNSNSDGPGQGMGILARRESVQIKEVRGMQSRLVRGTARGGGGVVLRGAGPAQELVTYIADEDAVAETNHGDAALLCLILPTGGAWSKPQRCDA